MAKKRKRTVKRRRKIRKLPNWALMVLGLAIGIVLTVLVELLIQRASSPGSGLRTLLTRAEKPTSIAADKSTARQAPSKTPKPKFDFYTILPEIETVLPNQRPITTTKSAKLAKPEKNVSYILQAASFAKYEDADRLKARLALSGLVTYIQKVTIEGKGEYHRVRLGPYDNLEELDAANRRLRELGIQALRLKVRREG